jgi:hypothetical protein
MARRYRETVEKLVRALAARSGSPHAAATLRASDGDAEPEVLDVDRALATFVRRGVPLPHSIEDRALLHIALLEADLPSLSA